MKHILNIATVITAIFATSCIKDDYIKEADYDFKTNYEAFWNYVNENYCYLGDNYGYTKNIDWHGVYDEMMPQVESAETESELLEIMGKSIDYLKDGHVWLDTKFKHRGCFTFYIDENGERYPDNFIKEPLRRSILTKPSKPETVTVTAPSQEVIKHSSMYITLISPRASSSRTSRCFSRS